MCIMNVVPPSAPIPNIQTLGACWSSNPQGAGYAFARDGILRQRKGFMTLQALIAALQEDFPAADGAPDPVNRPHPLSIHFRIGTHGANNPANTHPWPIVPGKVCLLHNGIMHHLDPAYIPGADPTASDSQWYAALLKPLFSAAISKANPGSSILNRPPLPEDPNARRLTNFARSIKAHIEAFIDGGYPNKIVILDHCGGVLICNSKAGNVDANGIWWSNYGWRSYGLFGGGGSDPRAYTPGAGCTTGAAHGSTKGKKYERWTRPGKSSALTSNKPPLLTCDDEYEGPRVFVNGQWQPARQTTFLEANADAAAAIESFNEGSTHA